MEVVFENTLTCVFIIVRLINFMHENWEFLSALFYCFLLFPMQPRTPLEEEVAAVLRGSSHVLERSNKELTEEEEKALLAMDLEEVSQ